MDDTQPGTTEEKLLASEESLEDRLKFETLLANLSARFVSLPADRIDGEIEAAQRRICEFLDIDRSTLWQVCGGEPQTLLLTHIHQPPGARQPPERMNAREFFPWSEGKVLGGETVAISKISDLPPEAGRDLESYRSFGTKSNVLVPLSVGGGTVFGLLTFSMMREERRWTETVLMGIKLVAQVFANALARRQANALHEREARLSLALKAAGAGLWIMYLGTRKVWVAAGTRELFHFTPDEELTYQSFFNVIHPEDRERVNAAVEQALRPEESLVIDFRIVLPDGNIRWIAARGHRYPNTEPDRLMGVSVDVTYRKRAEQALEERLRFERLMSDLSGRFATITLEQVDIEIRDALGKILEFFQADRIGLLTVSGDRTAWQIRHATFAEGIPSLPLRNNLPKSLFPWVFGKIVDQQEVVSMRSIQDLPEEAAVDKESLRKWGIRAFLNIPIVSGEIVSCVTITADRAERDWPTEYIPRLRLIGNVLFNAVDRERAEKEARALNRRLLTAHEDERRRLARELHDDLSQRLARLAIDAARVEPFLNSLSAVGLARSMREDAVRMSDDIHELSYRLHPSVLDDLGLGEALKAECDLFSRRESIRVELGTFNLPSELPSNVPLCLFRIAQGALRNVARHARASRVDLSLTVTDGGVQMTVKDDGVGFDPAQIRTRPSLGHASMRERIRLVHGTLAIQSAPGRGTTIQASVPFKGDSS